MEVGDQFYYKKKIRKKNGTVRYAVVSEGGENFRTKCHGSD